MKIKTHTSHCLNSYSNHSLMMNKLSKYVMCSMTFTLAHFLSTYRISSNELIKYDKHFIYFNKNLCFSAFTEPDSSLSYKAERDEFIKNAEDVMQLELWLPTYENWYTPLPYKKNIYEALSFSTYLPPLMHATIPNYYTIKKVLMSSAQKWMN